jgi:glycosyltransferase involved in cell wall biosynthesis
MTLSIDPSATPAARNGPAGAAPVPRPDGPRVSIVMPARNEARNLPHVFARIPPDIYEIVVVDGNSTDGTGAVAAQLDARVRLVGQSRKGKGNALAHGFAAVTGDIIVMLDADCSADPAEIPRFVATLREGADFAKGSRHLAEGGSEDLTRLRQTGNRMLTRTVNMLFGTAYTDLCYGYNAFWVHCLPHIDIDSDGFEVETMMNIRVAKAGLRVAEVPSFEKNRMFGNSNLNAVRDGARVARTIFREYSGTRQTPVVPTVERRAHPRGEGLSAEERRACFRFAVRSMA